MTATSLTADLLALAAAHDAEYTATAEPLIVTHGAGALFTDSEGNERIDLSDIVANVGHCHPRHVAAIQAAAEELITGKSGMLHPPRAHLVARLAALTPPNLDKVYLVSGGGEAIDWAVRIARRATGRHEILSFWGGVYGRTYATASLNGLQRRRQHMGPVMPGVVHAPYPYCYRCPFGKRPEDCDFFCIDYLDEVLDHASTGDVAALIVEPYLGVGGIIFPPEGYLTRLQAWARARDILFILDEVQASFGRTGKLFALEWEGLTPDMLVVGKGLGSGVGLAALLMESRLLEAMTPGELSGGNGGTYLACSSALAVLDILRDEGLPEHALQVGDTLLGRLKAWQAEFPAIGDVRGRGLCLALEFVQDRETKEPDRAFGRRVGEYCRAHGVYVGGRSHILDIRPPLVITQEQATQAADVIEAALRDATRHR